MNVRIVREMSTGGILSDVTQLIVEIARVGDAVGVVARLPDFASELFSCGEGEAAFDELRAALDGVVGRGR